MLETQNEGWICPTCKTIWAPRIASCPKCVVKEETVDTRQFLTETQQQYFGVDPGLLKFFNNLGLNK